MKYTFSYSNPNQHFVDIDFEISGIDSQKLVVNLPIWRPGRYEEGNFAKNIRGLRVVDAKGKELKYIKTQNHQWEIETKSVKTINIHYSYYCGKLDAGSCWLDEHQLYINPVHCLMYVEGWEHKPVSLHLNLPKDYQVACALKVEKGNILKAPDYHTMVDSPFIASADLKHKTYESNGIKFHIWFIGECTIEWSTILKDFKAFTDEEIALFGSFPAKEYHFLFQMLPMDFHHGVEHLASTVIALGKGYTLMNSMYEEFLGISSHELFHVWNVKTIRPVEMMPYRYTEKNLSRLGFVYEGITTYYGNLILYRCGSFSDSQYFNTLNERIQKHYHNYGRFNQAVGEASFDTWIDGYVDGIPHRKTNIYTEGCIIALLLDLTIRMYTKDKKSLDDVMRKLYVEATKKAYKGYSEADLQATVEAVAGCSYEKFFQAFVYGTMDTQPLLEEALSYIGCMLDIKPASTVHEGFLGFKLDIDNPKPIVRIIAPESPAEAAGLMIGDEIIAVNGIRVMNDFTALCKANYNKAITLSVFSQSRLKTFEIKETKTRFYSRYSVVPAMNANKQQLTSFARWAKSSSIK